MRDKAREFADLLAGTVVALSSPFWVLFKGPVGVMGFLIQLSIGIYIIHKSGWENT